MSTLSQIAFGAGILCFAGFLICFVCQEVPKCIKERDHIGLFLIGGLISMSFFMGAMLLEGPP